MDAEISRLEGQLEQLIGLFQSGKSEAQSLRARVAELESENGRLSQKLNVAISRFETLLERLPED